MPATDDPIPPATETVASAESGDSSPEPELVEDGAAERARIDLQLLRRAGAGDGQAFAELVERHAKSMYRLAYLLVGTAADAEDVLQETWTGVYKSLKRFEGRSTVRTWLTRILTTQVALWRRKRRGGVISLDESPQAQADALPGRQHSASRNSDWQADLQAALERLTSDHREVIVLREIQGLSYDEMAEALRVPRGTVESRLHRARGELRKLLQAYVP
jgi:RNA polymerase sigma-70 factor (ECF subfamily)